MRRGAGQEAIDLERADNSGDVIFNRLCDVLRVDRADRAGPDNLILRGDIQRGLGVINRILIGALRRVVAAAVPSRMVPTIIAESEVGLEIARALVGALLDSY